MDPNDPRSTLHRSPLDHSDVPEVVLLEDGDATFPAPPDDPQWDWDAESVAGPPRCQFCGAAEPLFLIQGGALACGACHGRPATSVPAPAERAGADAPSRRGPAGT